MSETSNVTYAPKVDPSTLWQMSANDFNTWREEFDYPRIVVFFKLKLPEFENWMKDQLISDELLIKHSPSTFLTREPILFYTVLQNNTNKEEIIYSVNNEEIISSVKCSEGKTLYHHCLVNQRIKIIPYPIWYRRKKKEESPGIYVNHRLGRSHIMLSGLELLDMGNCNISNLFIGNRKLDFVNISDLQITNCFNNTRLKLLFSSAYNLTITGDFPFLYAYQTQFSEGFNSRSNNLKLFNGAFQDWRFIDCHLEIYADNAIMQLWELTGENFDATISSTDIRDCTFKSSPIRYPIQLRRARVFHANIKRIYSQLGKKKEASNHYYWEKTYERKSFLHVRENHSKNFLQKTSKSGKIIVRLVFFLRYIRSAFLNLLWGYGERPARVFTISGATILIFALCYCYLPKASVETYHHLENSLYYSIVTFTTGDINQKDESIRLLCSLEALLGLSFWGILIAGFTNNAKDY